MAVPDPGMTIITIISNVQKKSLSPRICITDYYITTHNNLPAFGLPARISPAMIRKTAGYKAGYFRDEIWCRRFPRTDPDQVIVAGQLVPAIFHLRKKGLCKMLKGIQH
jgi:hypothetical protein